MRSVDAGPIVDGKHRVGTSLCVEPIDSRFCGIASADSAVGCNSQYPSCLRHSHFTELGISTAEGALAQRVQIVEVRDALGGDAIGLRR